MDLRILNLLHSFRELVLDSLWFNAVNVLEFEYELNIKNLFYFVMV